MEHLEQCSEKMCNMEHKHWSETVIGKSNVKLGLATDASRIYPTCLYTYGNFPSSDVVPHPRYLLSVHVQCQRLARAVQNNQMLI